MSPHQISLAPPVPQYRQSLARYLAIFYPARIDKIEQSSPQVAIQLKQANQSMNFAQLREQGFSQYSQAELDSFIQIASECKHLLQKRS